MKKTLAVLAFVALLSPISVFADIDIDSGFPTPQGATMEVGETITFTVRADTNGNGNDNDWKSTQWDVVTDGLSSVCDNNPQVTQSSNNVTATWDYTAVQAGLKTVEVKVYNSPNCQGSVRDTASTALTVTEPVVEEPVDTDGDGVVDEEDACPEVVGNLPNGCLEVVNEGGSEESVTEEPAAPTFGGGGPCHPNTGFPECQQNKAWFERQKYVDLYQQLIQTLNLLLWEMEKQTK